ncbi:MAG: hypothetical protein R3326_06255 [Gemmatimonadota bacterium]|nr:hypothetical protein [Gemmatimonadota bacterium]
MASFVDHLQILPVPSVGGVRQPDGDHRPGGLGMLTLADRLTARGWTARVEDIGFDKRLPEARIVESYARAIGDGVLSAWERNRFPIVLTRVSYGALGVVDALGEDTGVIWISPRVEYPKKGLLRRPPVERAALSLMTGRVERDSLAVSPVELPVDRVIVAGGWRTHESERDALVEAGARIVPREGLDTLADTVGAVNAERWYVHLDAPALDRGVAPAAADGSEGGFEPDSLVAALREALSERDVACLALARYDLNRDEGETTAETLTEILDALARVAGGHPRPETAAESPGPP